jgi:cyclase
VIPRVIPVLLLDRGGLVKTFKFRDPTYLGDPINAVRILNEKEVDELIFLDISATRDGQGPDFGLIERIASEAFMPFAYGGGVQTVEHALRLFSLGVEKVVLNTAARRSPQLVSEIAKQAGRSSVVVSVDVKNSFFGKRRVYDHAGAADGESDPVTFVRSMEAYGAGEVVLSSVDREGTMDGYDTELIGQVARAVGIPVIALGGSGSLLHMSQAVHAGASAVAAGSMFVFHGRRRAVLITYPAAATIRSAFVSHEQR